MNDEDIKAIECSINLGKETGAWLTISPFVLERLYNEYKKLQQENAQLRTKPNNKDKMIEMMAKELYYRVDNGVFGDSVEDIIEHFRKKVKDA